MERLHCQLASTKRSNRKSAIGNRQCSRTKVSHEEVVRTDLNPNWFWRVRSCWFWHLRRRPSRNMKGISRLSLRLNSNRDRPNHLQHHHQLPLQRHHQPLTTNLLKHPPRWSTNIQRRRNLLPVKATNTSHLRQLRRLLKPRVLTQNILPTTAPACS